MIKRLLHASLVVADLKKSRAFYEDVLGLKPNLNRPALSVAGIWYDIGAAQLHLLVSSGPTAKRIGSPHPGQDAHIAFAVTDIERVKEILKRADITFIMSRSGRKALFCRDPDGNALELSQA